MNRIISPDEAILAALARIEAKVDAALGRGGPIESAEATCARLNFPALTEKQKERNMAHNLRGYRTAGMLRTDRQLAPGWERGNPRGWVCTHVSGHEDETEDATYVHPEAFPMESGLGGYAACEAHAEAMGVFAKPNLQATSGVGGACQPFSKRCQAHSDEAADLDDACMADEMNEGHCEPGHCHLAQPKRCEWLAPFRCLLDAGHEGDHVHQRTANPEPQRDGADASGRCETCGGSSNVRERLRDARLQLSHALSRFVDAERAERHAATWKVLAKRYRAERKTFEAMWRGLLWRCEQYSKEVGDLKRAAPPQDVTAAVEAERAPAQPATVGDRRYGNQCRCGHNRGCHNSITSRCYGSETSCGCKGFTTPETAPVPDAPTCCPWWCANSLLIKGVMDAVMKSRHHIEDQVAYCCEECHHKGRQMHPAPEPIATPPAEPPITDAQLAEADSRFVASRPALDRAVKGLRDAEMLPTEVRPCYGWCGDVTRIYPWCSPECREAGRALRPRGEMGGAK